MAETLGSLIDKLSIMNLKLWHLEDECRRGDVDDAYVAGCKRKINIANRQRNDLMKEIDVMVVEIAKGRPPKVYDQLKMYLGEI